MEVVLKGGRGDFRTCIRASTSERSGEEQSAQAVSPSGLG